MNQQSLWRTYFAAAIAASAIVEAHNLDAMAKRAADIADAMMRVDGQRAPKSSDELRAEKEQTKTPKLTKGAR